MCKSSEDIYSFLVDIADKTFPIAKEQWRQLEAFANKNGVDNIEPWDVLYYSQKLKKEEFGIDEESLRSYFPINKVLDGLFFVISKIFSINLEVLDHKSSPKWLKGAFYHKDASKLIQIKRSDASYSYILLDLFARDAKRGGAWMNDLVSEV